jgi:hypothetical protein
MKIVLIFLFCLLVQELSAQRVSRDYRDRPMAEVLRDLGHAATRQRIIFIYNDLEDFTVTERFDSLTIAEAIRTCIGFYPTSLTARGDSVLLVECTQKKPYKLIGRLVDERGVPVGYANISLLSPSDSTSIINKGVSNQNGRFVIPTDSAEVVARISHVAYKPISRQYRATDVGTIRLETAIERLDSVSVTAQPMSHVESDYRQLAKQVARAVWNMSLPQFRVDTIPMKYREAPAVVLAEYDSIEFRQTKQPSEALFSNKNGRKGRKWLQTIHLHRTRYFVNHQDAARRLSQVVYSTQTDITNFVMYKLTVMGISIINPDGTRRNVDTFQHFRPRIHNREAAATDTIHIVGLEPGDILDIFIYHRYNEPLSPYSFRLPSAYPTLSYEARAVADRHTHLQYDEKYVAPTGQLYDDGMRKVLAYHLSDYDGNSPNVSPTVLLQARMNNKR